jgi:hypothetical protein
VGTQETGYYSQDTMWLDVYDAIRNDIPYPIKMEDGVNVVKLSELVHRQSPVDHEKVCLPEKSPF